MGIWSKWKEQSVTPLQKFHTIKTENLYDKNEQFSTEIKEKRRLYPILRQAKTDHKGASLITETLYIQGEKCDLLTGSAPRFYPDRTVSHYSTPAQSQQSGTTKHHQPINRQRQGSTPDRFERRTWEQTEPKLTDCNRKLNFLSQKNKLNYDEFNQFLSGFDNPGLTEMKTDDSDKNAIPGFVTHMKNRQKLSQTRSGGIILSVEKNLAKQVKIMKIDCKKSLQSSFKL